MFNAYKHQASFNVSTKEMLEKIYDGLWPFHPDNQPEGIIIEYNAFKKKFFPKTQHMALKQFDTDGSAISNG